jgi:hypothetical protein
MDNGTTASILPQIIINLLSYRTLLIAAGKLSISTTG